MPCTCITYKYTVHIILIKFPLTGFQALLVTSHQDSRKSFKPSKSSDTHTTQSVQLFLTQVLPPLENHGTEAPLTGDNFHQNDKALPSPEAISYHIDRLRLSQCCSAALHRSIEHMERYLVQGLKKSLASMNMRCVGQLLMADGALVASALSKSVVTVAQTSCPRYGFPPWSRLHFTENCSRAAYALAYDNYSHLQVFVDAIASLTLCSPVLYRTIHNIIVCRSPPLVNASLLSRQR